MQRHRIPVGMPRPRGVVLGTGWMVQGTITDHTAFCSGLPAPVQMLRESHYQPMALQGPVICEMSWESQPSGFCCKAVSANWARPRQGCGVNVPKRPRAKRGKGAEEALEMFKCHHARFPPAHLSMYPALMLSVHPLPILTPYTLPKNTSQGPEKGIKGSGTGKHLGRG